MQKFETGGEFWPTVHNCTIFSLVLMHIIVIGIFGLKELPIASGFTLPLPIVTLLFNEYCQKRFIPIFNAYPAEVHWSKIIFLIMIIDCFSSPLMFNCILVFPPLLSYMLIMPKYVFILSNDMIWLIEVMMITS